MKFISWMLTNQISRRRLLKMRRHAKRACYLGKRCTMRSIGIYQQLQLSPKVLDPAPLNLENLFESFYAIRREKLKDEARAQRLEEIKARDKMTATEREIRIVGRWK